MHLNSFDSHLDMLGYCPAQDAKYNDAQRAHYVLSAKINRRKVLNRSKRGSAAQNQE